MKHFAKKGLILLLCLSCIASIASCGGGETSSVQSPNSVVSESTSDTTSDITSSEGSSEGGMVVPPISNGGGYGGEDYH